MHYSWRARKPKPPAHVSAKQSSMKPEKTMGQPKIHSHSTTFQAHGQNWKKNPAEKAITIIKNMRETEGTADKETSCWNRLQYQ